MEAQWALYSLIITSILTPIVVGSFQYLIRRKELLHAEERQDAVAVQAAEAARLLAERQDQAADKAAEAAELLLAANERVAQTAQSTNDKLDTIHTLVNSNMTAALQAEFDATVREEAMMQEVIELKRAAGREPSETAQAALITTRAKIAELSANLTTRLEQQTPKVSA